MTMIVLHKDWKIIQDMPDPHEGCLLVFNQWFAGFQVINPETQAGTLVYTSPLAAMRAYDRNDVLSVTRLKMMIAQSKAARRVPVKLGAQTYRAGTGQR